MSTPQCLPGLGKGGAVLTSPDCRGPIPPTISPCSIPRLSHAADRAGSLGSYTIKFELRQRLEYPSCLGKCSLIIAPPTQFLPLFLNTAITVDTEAGSQTCRRRGGRKREGDYHAEDITEGLHSRKACYYSVILATRARGFFGFLFCF